MTEFYCHSRDVEEFSDSSGSVRDLRCLGRAGEPLCATGSATDPGDDAPRFFDAADVILSANCAELSRRLTEKNHNSARIARSVASVRISRGLAPQDGLKSDRTKSAASTTSMLSGERPPGRRRCTVIKEVHAARTPGGALVADCRRTFAFVDRGADRRLRRTTGARRVPSRPGTERPFDRGGDPAAATPAVGRETAEQAVLITRAIIPRRSIPCSREVMVDAHFPVASTLGRGRRSGPDRPAVLPLASTEESGDTPRS